MNNKVLIFVLFIFLLIGGWGNFAKGFIPEDDHYDDYMDIANLKFENTLYHDAGNYYMQAFDLRYTKEAIDRAISAYEMLWDTQHDSNAYELLLGALTMAYQQSPESIEYWEKAVRITVDNTDFDRALGILKAADESGVNSEYLSNAYLQVAYVYSLSSDSSTYISDPVNGYCRIEMDNNWCLRSMSDRKMTDKYVNVSFVGENQVFLREDADGIIEFWNLSGEKKGITKDRPTFFGIPSDGFCNVAYGDEYAIIDIYGEHLVDGLVYAGAFQNGYAPVERQDGSWAMVDESGTLHQIDAELVKCNEAGLYCVNETTIIKLNGLYCFGNYVGSSQKNEFVCKDMDYLTTDGIVAFKDNNDRWGFVNLDGDVVVEPQYENAKSFSNGLAAVCKDGKWGYINKRGQLVVEYSFGDAGYLSGSASCWVKDESGYYRYLSFEYGDLVK